MYCVAIVVFFFFTYSATTEIYTLSLHDALPIFRFRLPSRLPMMFILWMVAMMVVIIPSKGRSEERFSRNAETDIVCRLLLEKKKMYDGRGSLFETSAAPLIFYCEILSQYSTRSA